MALNTSAAIKLAPPQFQDPLRHTLNQFQIKNPTEFLATVFYESNYLSDLSENLNYTSDALLKRFSRQRISYEEAMKYGRTPYKPAYQEAIANCIYGGKWGRENLGNFLPGDGWHYRGQGAIQLTGRQVWEQFAEFIGRKDIAEHPSIVLNDPLLACQTAGWFWSKFKKLDQYGSDMRAITKKVTGAADTAIKTRLAYQSRVQQLITT